MKSFAKWTSAILTCSLCVGLSGNVPNASAANSRQGAAVDAFLTMDASVKYQKIDNFGASDAWSMEPLGRYWTEENKNRVADLLFSREKGIGLSAWRFNIGAGSTETDEAIITNPWRRAEAFKSSESGRYDWNKQAGQQWFLKAAKERGVDTLIAFVNSPPIWMTKNGHAQPDASVGSTNLKDGYEDEFAAFVSDVLEHFEEQGIPFDYISPINEPTWDWNRAGQEGNRYNNDDLKRVILALSGELKARGIPAHISAPDGVEITALLDDEFYQRFANKEQYTGGANSLGTGKYREYIQDLLGDPELKAAVGNKIASHSYWSDYSKTGDDRLGLLRDLLEENLKKYDPDAKYWMSEYCILGDYGPGRDLGIDPALHVARTIHFDLTRANAAAWQWWTAVSKEDYKDGLIYTDFNKAGDEQNILPSKILWALGNYSKFIRPGAERIELAGLDEEARSGLLGSAYKDEKEQTVTSVLVNDSTVDKRVKLSIQGLDPKDAVFVLKPYITSRDQDLAKGESVARQPDGTFETVIPARSVVTLSGDLVKKNKKPDAPENVRVLSANKGLQIEFTPPKGAYEYEVTYAEKKGNRERKVKVTADDVITLSGLTNGKEYAVTLRAGNANGFGPPSKRVYGVPKLLAPSRVTAAGTDGGFTVKYDAGVGVPAYRVRFGTQPGSYTQETSAAPSETMEVDGLKNGTVYYGVVEAVDGNQVSPPSPAFQVKPDIPAPGKVLAIAGDAKVHLEAAPVQGAAGYRFEITTGSKPAASEQSVSGALDLEHLTNGTPVAVRVYSTGKGGSGTAFSGTVVTPKAEEVRFEDGFEAGGMERYQQDVSQWLIEDGRLKHASGADSQGEIGIKDLRIIDGTLTAIARHSTAGADWGIAFRGTSYDKGYMFGFENGSLVIRKDGQNLAASVPFTARLGELYLLEVRLQGKRIQALIDGEPVFDVTDTAYTGGRVGLHSWGDAEFSYLKAAREAAASLARPEIYLVKGGDRQVALKYSEVDGAESYTIRYQALDGSGTAPVEIPAGPGSTLVTGLSNDVTHSFTVAAKRGTEEADSEPVTAVPAGGANGILFYADAGDGTPSQLEPGEQLGALQTLEEQPYGPDPVTGIKWGYEADDGLTWAHTSPVEAYQTIRQYDGNENGKGLAYRFQLPNGSYKVRVGFFDPWAADDRRMNLTLNGETRLTDYVVGKQQEEKAFDVEVGGGELIVKVVKAGGSKPMLSYITVEQR
ncbi:glycoside hydrolase [Paenibacillus sp. S-38]|uniref:glycoside hydrolase n=1 Tax=Paenibacillus sp. S-38 TaxID=3416710 RepID=UPI003CE9C3CA